MSLTDLVGDLVHEPTQTEGPGLDLTAGAISRVTAPGRVDFGGSELAPAEVDPISTERRQPEDDYGWWTLSAGDYLLEYNERLVAPGDPSVVLQPRRALRERGASHPTLHLEGTASLGPVPLAVGEGGIDIKENARVSTLLSIDP